MSCGAGKGFCGEPGLLPVNQRLRALFFQYLSLLDWERGVWLMGFQATKAVSLDTQFGSPGVTLTRWWDMLMEQMEKSH